MKITKHLLLFLFMLLSVAAASQVRMTETVPKGAWAYTAVLKLEKLTGLKVVNTCLAPPGRLMTRAEFAACAGRYEQLISQKPLESGKLTTAKSLVSKLKGEFRAEMVVIYGK